MGLAASQARLLSITARLTHNETQSQLITNAKLRLSDKSHEASREYLESLNSEKLTYSYYNANSEVSQKDLTAGLIYTYSPLKNQYALINQSTGRIFVSPQDADNFQNTDTLEDFLDCYGLYESTDESKKYDELMDKYNQDMIEFNKEKEKYNEQMKDYDRQKAEYDAKKAEYDAKKAEYDAEFGKYMQELQKYEEAYAKWLEESGKQDLYNKFSGAVGTSDIKDGPELTGSKGCYWHALNPVDQNSASCYEHVLNHLIDFDGNHSGNNGNGGVYTTSAGEQITINSPSVGYMGGTCNDTMAEVSAAINEKDENGDYKRYCDGTDDYLGERGVKNILEQAQKDYAAGKIGETELKMYTLLSDYVDNGDGTYSVKPLKQKAIDMMYISRNWGPAISNSNPAETGEFPESMLPRDFMVSMLINFTDGDMRNLSQEPEKPEFNGVLPDPIPPFDVELPAMPPEPPRPEKPPYEITLNDRERSQWYVNLWHKMNGSESANLVKALTSEYGDVVLGDYSKEIIYTVENANKKSDRQNYEIFDENLFNNPDWLQFSLEHGTITLAHAQFTDPTVDGGKAPDIISTGITWQSIIYSTASEISFTEDSLAISEAEIKYQKITAEIQAKDKKYDNDLKKLDATHNALQTEYDSLKSVIEKNTERSFKAFS